MATSNRDRVGKGLELLASGLRPFVLREMQAALGDGWETEIENPGKPGSSEAEYRDAYTLLKAMWDVWRQVFGKVLGYTERTLVSELRETRNRWAHNEPFSTDDTYRSLDSVQRLLAAVSAPEAVEVDRMKQEVLRVRFDEQAKRDSRRAGQIALEGTPAAGLMPWRHVIKPHHDVATGRYQTAEFAADLAQVHRGEGSDEYRDPVEFFRRTYMTEGLRSLLTRAAQRLADEGGDPIVELQTNFGGGKTHSLLALYHLFSSASVESLLGAEELFASAGVTRPTLVRRAVIVGTAVAPGQPSIKPEGTVVRTLWGEIAWQLGGAEGFAMVAEADATSTSPGSALVDLLKRYSPCVLLIDEWVAYARQLYSNSDLPAGTFDTHFTFAQALTEAVSAVPGTLLVVSIPASDNVRDVSDADGSASAAEIGGEGGFEALKRLKNVVGRLQSPWRPASAEESFEIVRRRLFEDITDPDASAARDAVVQGYVDLYASQRDEFPSECRDADYRRRMKVAYPIHPELFDRLYQDWSSLERFQRTRGVLRLMAAVIHALWSRDDSSLLIAPGNVPIDDDSVLFELTRYLEDAWKPIIEKDVDGAGSLPVAIDRESPNLGRYSASRRVARTVYIGSAPTVGTKHPGIEDKRIKLGCVQPGEPPAVFGDALRRLSDRATHLTTDGTRYSFSVRPTLTRLAHDRADALKPADVEAEIVRLLRGPTAQRGDFCGVHIAPESASEVADDAEARLVVLGPQFTHSAKTDSSEARRRAAEILEDRGTGPRRFRNMLVFLAPDRTTLESLVAAVRLRLAWESIRRDATVQNLGPAEMQQVETRIRDTSEATRQRVSETWQWVLVPDQPNPSGAMEWRAMKVGGDENLAVRVSRKLVSEEQIITGMAGTVLRMHLDRIPLWKDDGIGIRPLWELFAQYLYLPRMRDIRVLLGAVQDGIASLNWQAETFGYAEAFDETSALYRGLHGGEAAGVMASGYIVKAEAFARYGGGVQGTLPIPGGAAAPATLWGAGGVDGASGDAPAVCDEAPAGPSLPHRFHGTVRINAAAPGGDAARIGEHVISHLAAFPGATVVVELDIQIEVPGGVPEGVQRTVLENASVLRFQTGFGFEEE